MGKLNNFGFTLIEILVVISVIGLLSGLVVVNLQGIRQKATIAQSLTFSASVRQKIGIDIAGAWNLDEGSGTIAKDSSGMGNNGTLVGSPTWLAEDNCVSNSCLQFNGSNYVDILNMADVNCDEVTVDFFMKDIGTSVSWNDYVNFYYGSNRITAEYYAVSGLLIPIVRIGAGNYDAPSMPIGSEFNYYAIVLSKSGNFRKSYKNGKLIGTAVGWPGGFSVSQAAIGQGSSSIVDEVRIYGAALTASEIKDHYLAGLDKLLANKRIAYQDYLERINGAID
jgi:prepilin-type N-terminal cleavage/methylation domain-containing protein